VYLIFNSAGQPKYTGQTVDLSGRLRAHRWCLTHFKRRTKGWTVLVAPMPGSTRRKRKAVELDLIRTTPGLGNVQGRVQREMEEETALNGAL
jgi:hypothetical protein